MPRAFRPIGAGLVVIAAAAAVVGVFGHRTPRHPASVSLPKPMVSATKPTTRPAPVRSVGYLDVVRATNLLVTADRLLDTPVSLDDSARLRLTGPLYLDPVGHLWITRARAAPLSQTLAHWTDAGPTVLPDTPVFVHWYTDAAGNFVPAVVCRSASSRGYDIIATGGRRHWTGPEDCDWARAFSFAGRVVVPTASGVTVLEFLDWGHGIAEYPMSLANLPPGANPPVVVLDSRGVLAWSPWEHGRAGSGGAMRFVDGLWSPIDPGARLVQMVPLLDGSVLVVRRDGPGHVTLAIEPLENTDLDRKHLADLIAKLSDDDPDVRESAYAELSRYGPGLWPVLEQSLDDQPPEARLRVQRLLRGKIAPALGGMMLVDGRLETVSRQPDGAIVFYAPAGVELPGIAPEPIRVTPGWIVLHPGGRFGRPLTSGLVADQSPEHFTLVSSGDDWYTCDAAGPRRFLGGEWVSLLRPEELAFNRMIGQDAQGRWIFQRPAADEYLLLDPTVLDPTPRLPVWSIRFQGKDTHVDRDRDGWPMLTRAQNSWSLHADGWAAAATADVAPAATGGPLLVCPDGTRYSGGETSLTVDPAHGPRVVWPLPGNAVGSSDPNLVRTADGLLFLFNAPGRVVRIRPTLGGPQPFVIDATFTRDVPNVRRYDRLWLDPAGRIDCAFDGNQLTVLFPTGHMPAELAHMQVKMNP